MRVEFSKMVFGFAVVFWSLIWSKIGTTPRLTLKNDQWLWSCDRAERRFQTAYACLDSMKFAH